MAGTLVVDKAVLGEQITKMSNLANSDALRTSISNLNGVISMSSGDTAMKAMELIDTFSDLESKLLTLYQRTHDFLNNKNGDFVEADETLSG